jgi:hypothetical protein
MLDVTAPETRYATVEWEVIDLLLSDERFVQEAFEEIVAIEWPRTPDTPGTNPPGAAGSTAGAGNSGCFPGGRRLTTQCRHRPGASGWARERSPPKRPIVSHIQPACTGGDAHT